MLSDDDVFIVQGCIPLDQSSILELDRADVSTELDGVMGVPPVRGNDPGQIPPLLRQLSQQSNELESKYLIS